MSSANKHLVPGVVAATFVRFALDANLPSTIFAGLPPEVRPGRALGTAVKFGDIAMLLTRIENDNPANLDHLVEFYVRKVPMVSYLASFAISERSLAKITLFGWKRIWPMLNFKAADVDGGFVLRASIAPDCPPAATLLTMCGKILARLPDLIGRPHNDVDTAVSRDGRSALWQVAYHRDAIVHSDDGDMDSEAIFSNVLAKFFGHGGPRPAPPEWGLTQTEDKIVKMLASGNSINEIAVLLSVGRETVRTMVKRAMSKAGVKRQVELVLALRG
jgi:DNA-binding CsgD family transcriptional regulator